MERIQCGLHRAQCEQSYARLLSSQGRVELCYVTDVDVVESHDVPEISKTKLTWITTSSALKELVATLDRAKEFAIAVHQHDYHSYLGTSLHVFHLGFSIYHSLMIGFVALMQISTRTEDFLVDSIVLFEELHLLNQVTTNPNILKVRFCCRCIV